MRPHLLRLQAFGAFPDETTLDLDALAEQGLVLFTGDTGSGKTTLLDAIAFALYGAVAGERNRAKELRSHHAGELVEPWVELEFTAGGRRLRVRRSPAWTRPGRGDKLRDIPAKAVLSDLRDGVWTPVSTRLDEIGLELAGVLGMSVDQFHSVVVLPQGKFATFLQADSKDREALLRKLFHVERFESVQRWLTERAAVANDALAAGRAVADTLAARVAQAAGVEVADSGSVVSWATGLLAAAAAEHDAATEALEAAAADRAARAEELAGAQELRRRQGARAAAEAEAQALAAEGESIEQLRRRLELAGRAGPVVLAHELWQETAQTAEAAAAALPGWDIALRDAGLADHARLAAVAAVAAAWAYEGGGDPTVDAPASAPPSAPVAEPTGGVRTMVGGASPRIADAEVAVLLSELTVALRAADERRGRLAGLTALIGTAEQARAEEQAARTVIAAAAAVTESANGVIAESPGLITVAQEELASARVAATAIGDLRARTAEAEAAVGLSADIDAAAVALRRYEAARTEAERRLADAIDAERAARNERIEAAAAELAFGLADDTPCPVCGSLDHPEPAELADSSVTREQERRLGGEIEESRRAVTESLAREAGAKARLAALDERRAPAGAHRAPAELRLACEQAQQAAATAPELEARLETFTARLAAARQDAATAAAESEAAERALASAATRAAAAEGAIRGETGGRSVEDLHRDLDRLATAAAGASAALTAWQEAARAERRAAGHRAAQSSACGFTTAAEALAGAMPPAAVEQSSRQVSDHETARAAVAARLADPELAVELTPPAAVDAAAEAAAAARKREAAAIADATMTRTRLGDLSKLVPAVADAAAAVAPLQAEASTLRELAEVANGRGANRLRMTLASFVLAARLEEVAEAATVRLERMTAGRYQLVHTDAGRDARSRAGLALAVEDSWTGRRRDTATLSGGETFQAALALALGLADVVTAESGGARIDTLFVDEGFGSLDPDSLDSVMDVLDELRAGGRLVGVVSHVSEMRQRIPAQILVSKGQRGSAVRLTGVS